MTDLPFWERGKNRESLLAGISLANWGRGGVARFGLVVKPGFWK
jgi:hypothetical protein